MVPQLTLPSLPIPGMKTLGAFAYKKEGTDKEITNLEAKEASVTIRAHQ